MAELPSDERWERFCNWLEAKPWRWRYDRIWRGIQGDPPFLRRLWWTVTFPHVHHDDEGAVGDLACREQEIKTLCELLERAQEHTDYWPDDLTEELRLTLLAIGRQ